MRYFALPVVILFLLFTGPRCVKNTAACTPNSPASEAPQIQAFATSNNINAVAHSSGLYYEIIDPGTGITPTINSKIVITYTGELLNGTVFDQQLTPNTGTPWALSNLIEGWKIGIPLIRKGGHIKLIIPSSMAYGCTGKGMIPGNSIVYFDINLIDVQ